MKKAMMLACGLALGAVAMAQGRDAPARDPLPRGVVVDAAGKAVGRYIAEDGENAFALARLGGVVTSIPLQRHIDGDGRVRQSLLAPARLSRGEGVRFDGPACTGTPYFQTDRFLGGMPSEIINTNDGRALLYVASSDIGVAVTTQSRQRATGECLEEVTGGTLFPVGQVVDLGATFSVPYSLR